MSDAEKDGPWLEIAVEVAGIDAEIAADLLRQACPGGVAIESPSRLDRETDTYVRDGDAPAIVKGYVRPDADITLIERLQVALQAAPLQRAAQWHEPRELAEVVWRDAWKKYFGVLRVGQRLVIVPSWIEYAPRPDDIVINIDPGMAFGTGQHPTTAMCLAALEEKVTPGASVLDLGCGSGILGIAAAKLGAGRIVGLDTDPLAVKATRENAAANGVTIDVSEGTLEGAGQFDIVVANISGLTLERLSAQITRALRRGGHFIASGFLDERVDELCAAFEHVGLSPERVVEDGVWRAIIAERR